MKIINNVSQSQFINAKNKLNNTKNLKYVCKKVCNIVFDIHPTFYPKSVGDLNKIFYNATQIYLTYNFLGNCNKNTKKFDLNGLFYMRFLVYNISWVFIKSIFVTNIAEKSCFCYYDMAESSLCIYPHAHNYDKHRKLEEYFWMKQAYRNTPLNIKCAHLWMKLQFLQQFCHFSLQVRSKREINKFVEVFLKLFQDIVKVLTLLETIFLLLKN